MTKNSQTGQVFTYVCWNIFSFFFVVYKNKENLVIFLITCKRYFVVIFTIRFSKLTHFDIFKKQKFIRDFVDTPVETIVGIFKLYLTVFKSHENFTMSTNKQPKNPNKKRCNIRLFYFNNHVYFYIKQ